MDQAIFFDICRQRGIIRTGHFVLSQGLHSANYFNLKQIFAGQDDDLLLDISDDLARKLLDGDGRTTSAQVLIGPETGGANLAEHVADAIKTLTDFGPKVVRGKKIGGGNFSLSGEDRAFIAGKNCVVVEDVWETGSSAIKSAVCGREAGGNVYMIMAAVERVDPSRGSAKGLGFALYQFPSQTHEHQPPDNPCPLCIAKVPINTEVGHGREFLERLEHLEFLDS